MLGISGTELVLILFFGFLIFGPEKLPQMGRTVGRAIRQFRTASEAANAKFKEEVYDPFKEAVEPYAEEIREQGAPLKEDLDAINSTLKETQDMFKDPFRFNSSDKDGSSSGSGSIKGMMDDMLKDPLDLKKEKDADKEAGAEGKPLPDSGGSVKKSMAASLYGLDGASTSSQAQVSPLEDGSAGSAASTFGSAPSASGASSAVGAAPSPDSASAGTAATTSPEASVPDPFADTVTTGGE